MVLSGCRMLAAARTPCSSDTNHSFVLGIVLGSYKGSDYTEDNHLGDYSQAQHMNAESYYRILPPGTQTKDALLQTCQRQDQVTEHHPVTTNSTPNHGRSQHSVPSTRLGSKPWRFPASPFFTSATMMNFIQNIPKAKQMNKQKKIMEKETSKIQKGGKHALRKVESSAWGGRPRPKQATCCEPGAWAPFVNSYIPDSAFCLVVFRTTPLQ